MTCAAYGCKNRPHYKTEGITYHRFPADVNRRHQWVLAVRRANFVPSRHSTLCSLHFEEEMFDRCSTLRVRLHPDAVPTIFEGFPSHIKQDLDPLKPTVKQEPIEEVSNDTDIQTESFSSCDKNRILVVPGDMDILSNYSSSNGNTKDQNHVFIISDDTDNNTVLNDVDDSDDHRVIIVSDGTNMQSEWCGNIGEDSFLNGMVTLEDTDIETEPLNNCIAESSYNNPLLLHNNEFYIKRIQELEAVMAKLQKKLRNLRQNSRRNKSKITRLKKEVVILNQRSRPLPRSAKPIVHLITCDR